MYCNRSTATSTATDCPKMPVRYRPQPFAGVVRAQTSQSANTHGHLRAPLDNPVGWGSNPSGRANSDSHPARCSETKPGERPEYCNKYCETPNPTVVPPGPRIAVPSGRMLKHEQTSARRTDRACRNLCQAALRQRGSPRPVEAGPFAAGLNVVVAVDCQWVVHLLVAVWRAVQPSAADGLRRCWG